MMISNTNTTEPVTLFHAPNTRSTGVLLLLEELGAPYQLQLLNLKKEEQSQPEYLAINPMGKVPALKHGEAIITEQVAIFLYLADLYPNAGLAPAIGDPLRGPYLRWMVYYGSCFEPAISDRAQKHEPGSKRMSPYGDFDTLFLTVTNQLAKGPYFLGDTFTAVDILWGMALSWIVRFQLIPAVPVIQTYIDRINARPSVARIQAQDAALAATQNSF